VQAYIAAMPGWKRDVGRRLDALIVRAVPDVRKAVKWNSPFYGVEGQGWFLNVHTFTHYVRVAFFRGTSLRPLPPVRSKHEEVRYLDIREDDEIDEEFLASWIRQAAELPGWVRSAAATMAIPSSVRASPARHAGTIPQPAPACSSGWSAHLAPRCPAADFSNTAT
jgi:hypothetical protein